MARRMAPPDTHRTAPVCLLVLAVFAFIGAVWLLILDRAEQREFDALVAEARAANPAIAPHSGADVLNIMSRVNGRLKVIPLDTHATSTFNSTLYISSSHEQLRNPVGMCASYSHVLAKALMTAGYRVRKVGLAKGSRRAIHHVIEVQTGSAWVLLDALYNLAFRAPDGHLASAAEVSRDWRWYQTQVPAGYHPDFDYSTFYYTNWERMPGLGWALRSVPSLQTWLHEQGISVRFWFFNTYRWEAGICLTLSVGLWGLRRRLLRRPVSV